jgi:hypothetical protein
VPEVGDSHRRWNNSQGYLPGFAGTVPIETIHMGTGCAITGTVSRPWVDTLAEAFPASQNGDLAGDGEEVRSEVQSLPARLQERPL